MPTSKNPWGSWVSLLALLTPLFLVHSYKPYVIWCAGWPDFGLGTRPTACLPTCGADNISQRLPWHGKFCFAEPPVSNKASPSSNAMTSCRWPNTNSTPPTRVMNHLWRRSWCGLIGRPCGLLQPLCHLHSSSPNKQYCLTLQQRNQYATPQNQWQKLIQPKATPAQLPTTPFVSSLRQTPESECPLFVDEWGGTH